MRTVVFGQREFSVQVGFQESFLLDDFDERSIDGFLVFLALISNDGFL